ncbi:hypothetical protein H310_10386 [Aphanomyces invadans]|uniref:Major facilitator superfamily (MFS) profile domain-containing protein n=1 Tax=Aphanomyces invadans TaxID=157072 RepID=A0A024TS55_9STRA|nr:hypothetical protein H310_10386 [Aphanomyces invadans]ETV96192.1 hypothetical protein H310_10386 [Aphanomyces invadans]|eukprot:XP_008874984.1 hypothetical protein H310_10386 [Aphanomyces invadans]
MLHCVTNYWKVVVPTKSVAELDADQWLFVATFDGTTYFWFPRLQFSRWWLLAVCSLANLCTGSLLAFTSLYDGLDVYFYGSQTKESVSIQLQTYVWLGLSAAVSGPLVEKRGARFGMTAGTVVIAVGFVMSQLAVGAFSPTFLTVGYAVFCGAGFGLVLIATMAATQKWFPDLRGLVSGVLMFAFGVGNAMWTAIYTKLLHRRGLFDPVTDVTNVPTIFWSNGLAIVLALVLASLVIRTPPSTFTVNGHDIHCVPETKAPDPKHIEDEYLKLGMTLVNYSVVQRELEGTDMHYFAQVKALSLLQCIFSSDFLCLYVAFAATIIPAQVLSTELVDICTGVFHESIDATNALMTTGVLVNAAGRLVVPLISDAFIRIFYANPALARKAVLMLVLTYQVVYLVMAPKATMAFTAFRVFSLSFVFASGGSMAIIQCFATDMFGVYHAGTMYGLLLTCWSLRAILVGYAFSTFQVTAASFQLQLEWMVGMALVGWVALVFVRTNSMDRFFVGYQYSICGRIVFQYAFHPNTNALDDHDVVTIPAPGAAHSLSDNDFMLWPAETTQSPRPSFTRHSSMTPQPHTHLHWP